MYSSYSGKGSFSSKHEQRTINFPSRTTRDSILSPWGVTLPPSSCFTYILNPHSVLDLRTGEARRHVGRRPKQVCFAQWSVPVRITIPLTPTTLLSTPSHYCNFPLISSHTSNQTHMARSQTTGTRRPLRRRLRRVPRPRLLLRKRPSPRKRQDPLPEVVTTTAVEEGAPTPRVKIGSRCKVRLMRPRSPAHASIAVTGPVCVRWLLSRCVGRS